MFLLIHRKIDVFDTKAAHLCHDFVNPTQHWHLRHQSNLFSSPGGGPQRFASWFSHMIYLCYISIYIYIYITFICGLYIWYMYIYIHKYMKIYIYNIRKYNIYPPTPWAWRNHQTCAQLYSTQVIFLFVPPCVFGTLCHSLLLVLPFTNCNLLILHLVSYTFFDCMVFIWG